MIVPVHIVGWLPVYCIFSVGRSDVARSVEIVFGCIVYTVSPSIHVEDLDIFRKNLGGYKNELFKGCGNANPQQITSAFTGISAEVCPL